jgi:hypothetical protein
VSSWDDHGSDNSGGGAYDDPRGGNDGCQEQLNAKALQVGASSRTFKKEFTLKPRNLFWGEPVLADHTRGVWQRIRADWTQLSFLLYGGLVITITLMFDEYHHAEVWRFMAWACLALGAWLYLRAKRRKLRILALVCAATGTMWIIALAKWVLIPLQKWPTGYPVSPSEATRWVETGSALFGWIWILIMLLAPALLSLLPPAPDPVASSERGPAPA